MGFFKAIFDVDLNTSDKVTIEVFDDDYGKDDSLGNASLNVDKSVDSSGKM